MVLLLIQPLLIGGVLPGIQRRMTRRYHQWFGALLVLAVVGHIAGLWITSPPDVIDVLLFRSPTHFSVWGAVAMWALFLAAAVVTFRRSLKLRPSTWKAAHTVLAILVVVGSIIHALLIEGYDGNSVQNRIMHNGGTRYNQSVKGRQKLEQHHAFIQSLIRTWCSRLRRSFLLVFVRSFPYVEN